jgi:hypothetical protein
MYGHAAGAGVDEQGVGLGDRQWQSGQEGELLGIEPRARPLDDLAGLGHHARQRALHHRRIVVAEHGDGALRHMLPHPVDDPAGVGPVADEVAQERVALRSLGLRMRQHRRHRLAVGVQIGDEGELHRGQALRSSRCGRAAGTP